MSDETRTEEEQPQVAAPAPAEPVAGEQGSAADADVEAADDVDTEEQKGKQRPFWLELPILILLAFALALFLKQFVVQAFYIPSESMIPTLQVEDRILVDKMVYRFREPRRGEIVVFIAEEAAPQSLLGRIKSVLLEGFGVQRPQGDIDYVKRIIGLPGETIEMVAGTVYITPPGGERFALDEPYIEYPDTYDLDPTIVPEGHFYVLGDNRGASSDSRVRGPIAEDDIVGRARLRIWPLDRLGRFPTPSYDQTASDAGG